jgi:hypothetical protein
MLRCTVLLTELRVVFGQADRASSVEPGNGPGAQKMLPDEFIPNHRSLRYITTDGQSGQPVLVSRTHLGTNTRFLLFFFFKLFLDRYGRAHVGRPL